MYIFLILPPYWLFIFGLSFYLCFYILFPASCFAFFLFISSCVVLLIPRVRILSCIPPVLSLLHPLLLLETHTVEVH